MKTSRVFQNERVANRKAECVRSFSVNTLNPLHRCSEEVEMQELQVDQFELKPSGVQRQSRF